MQASEEASFVYAPAPAQAPQLAAEGAVSEEEEAVAEVEAASADAALPKAVSAEEAGSQTYLCSPAAQVRLRAPHASGPSGAPIELNRNDPEDADGTVGAIGTGQQAVGENAALELVEGLLSAYCEEVVAVDYKRDCQLHMVEKPSFLRTFW